MARVIIFAGLAISASFPPFTCEMCLRTMFISLISNPDESNKLFNCCKSVNGILFSGKASNADAPPDKRKIIKSSASAFLQIFKISFVPNIPLESGTGCAASIIWASTTEVENPYFVIIKLSETFSDKIFKTASAIFADAFPAPTT